MTEMDERLEKANRLIEVIASHGRKFFRYEDRVAYLEVDARGRVWFHDPYNQARIYTHYEGRWKKFTSGGTLKALIGDLQKYVKTGRKLSRGRFWWPDWYARGDLWGYGEAMEPIRECATALDMVRQRP